MNKFTDLDPIELEMGKRVELMDERELFDYFAAWYTGLFAVSLPQDRVRELSMFKRMKTVYKGEAGKIIKWVFFKYKGEWTNQKGKTIRIKTNWWGSREKHWHDTMLDELREEIAKERKTSKSKQSGEPTGFKTAADFLR